MKAGRRYFGGRWVRSRWGTPRRGNVALTRSSEERTSVRRLPRKVTHPEGIGREDLTPFVLLLSSAIDEALEALFELPPGHRIEWKPELISRKRLTGKLRVTVWKKDRRVVMAVIELAEKEGRRVVKFQRPELAFRSLNDPKAYALDLDYPLLIHIVAHGIAKARAPWRARLAKALLRYWKYVDVADWMYRQVSSRHQTSALLRLGFRCNQRCSFCWQGRDWPDAPDELYRAWLKEFAKAGIEALTLTGGEPSLHPLLVELVARASKEHGMNVWVQTNAMRMRHAPFRDLLREAGLVGIHVSYHSATAAISDQMTGVRGGHARSVEGVLGCLGDDIAVSFNCVVERANAAGLEAHAVDIVERFVRPFKEGLVHSVDYSFPSHYHSDEVWRASVVPLDEVAAPLVAAVRCLNAAGVRAELFSDCGFPTCVVRDAVDLIPSFESRELYGMDQEGRVWVEACDGCALKAECLGLRREYVEVHGGRGVVPFEQVPEGRDRAPGLPALAASEPPRDEEL